MAQRTTQPPVGGASQAQNNRAAQAGPSAQTETETETPAPAILRLRGAHPPRGRSVQWADNVVDNEGLGRKTSKVCCIYHRPKAVDESSDESSSESSSDSSDADSDAGEGSSAPRKDGDDGNKRGCDHNHKHGRGRPRGKGDDDKAEGKRRSSPNAYEKMPKSKPKGGPSGAS